jgi:hypothetical protein
MIKLGKESNIVLLAVLTVSLIANVAACFTISQYTTLPEPIVKTVLVHDTVTVTKTVYSVEFDTIQVKSCNGKRFYSVDEIVFDRVALPPLPKYKDSPFRVGYFDVKQIKNGYQEHIWGPSFSGLTEMTVGCHGKITKTSGHQWCSNEWVILLKEPRPPKELMETEEFKQINKRVKYD